MVEGLAQIGHGTFLMRQREPSGGVAISADI